MTILFPKDALKKLGLTIDKQKIHRIDVKTFVRHVTEAGFKGDAAKVHDWVNGEHGRAYTEAEAPARRATWERNAQRHGARCRVRP